MSVGYVCIPKILANCLGVLYSSMPWKCLSYETKYFMPNSRVAVSCARSFWLIWLTYFVVRWFSWCLKMILHVVNR